MQEMQQTQVQSLSQEEPPEEEMATHPSILAWRIPSREEPGGLHGITKSQTRLTQPSMNACSGGGRGRERNTALGLQGK